MLGGQTTLIFSEFLTAADWKAILGILKTSNKESLFTKVVDLFELYNLESEFALFGLQKREIWSDYHQLQNMEEFISGRKGW